MEERVNIAQQVGDIIAERQKRLPQIENMRSHLDRISEMLRRLEEARSDMVDQEGKALTDGKYGKMLTASPELSGMVYHLNLSGCREKIAIARERLQAYEMRSRRENVYISVVGLARSGKSAVLQGFSGLNNHVIPSFDAEDCTGTTSVIYNIPGQTIRAHLTFKSKKDMLALVQSYLDKLYGVNNPKRYIVHSFEKIKNLGTNSAVLQEIKANLPESANLLLMKSLVKIADHFDEWKDLAGADGKTLYDEEEIITYVAQNNGKQRGTAERRDYYRYLAVDTCRIECSFPGEDLGSIVLIDTIGLGDHAIGIADSMIRTVRDESDAVIMLINPVNGAGSGVDAAVTEQLYEPIRDACKDRKLKDWLFVLLNNVTAAQLDANGQVVRAVNTAHCESALKTLNDDVNWTTTKPRIVDARNPEATKKFLHDVLAELLTRLSSVDEIFLRTANEALEEVWREYAAIADKVAAMSKTAIQNNTQTNQLIQNLFNAEWKNGIMAGLNQFAKEWSEKRNTPCTGLLMVTKAILERMMEGASYIPTHEELEKELVISNNYLTVLEAAMNSARTQIKNDFLSANSALDRYVISMKTEVADMLYGKLGLEKLSRKQEGQTSMEWLQAFSEDRLAGYPNLQFAVNTLLNFDFSVKGFLTYEVREELERLNFATQNAPHVVRLVNNGQVDSACTAINIYDELDRRVVAACRGLQAVIQNLCIKPSRALYAEVEDFVDRLLRAPGIKEEWNLFFIGEAGNFWAEEIAANQQNIVVSQEWNELTQGIRRLKVHENLKLRDCVKKEETRV